MNRELMRALENGLTVEELIEELQQFDPKSKIVFEYQSSDYWKTRVARVVETVDEGEVGWSEYHKLPKPTDEGDENTVGVVVLNLGE